HYEFWRKYSKKEPRVSKFKMYGILFLEAVFGATFAIKFLERHEKRTVKQYSAIEKYIPENDRARFDEIVKDEREQEEKLASQVQSSAIKYMSFVVLGLADAIVEVSGIHAGSLGVYSSTELTGLAGIIAGAAASMAMASAAYAQAKQGFQGSAAMSAVITGVSYFVNAVFLATPYFLLRTAVEAMFLSLLIATIVLACTSYYNSIISGAHFLRDFSELAGIMFGATVALYLFGEAMRAYFGITI
ncbi:MAG: rubrerythrin family protein, partial [Thaumarchaeota archaeon]|nr:rubrerythrin family protein [Nitrososphaerota archaeon]